LKKENADPAQAADNSYTGDDYIYAWPYWYYSTAVWCITDRETAMKDMKGLYRQSGQVVV